LSFISFADSSFLPIIPDILLAPMVLARPARWLWLATLTTVTSVVGGLVGYAIGHYLMEAILPWFERIGWHDEYLATAAWFATYGVWIVIAKGLTPIPFKILTITAGAVGMPVIPFLIASIVSRSMRFYLVAGAVRFAGPGAEPWMRRNVEPIGWALTAAIVAFVGWHIAR
jgi:membrane protein YqaA with SNARE-associated domain